MTDPARRQREGEVMRPTRSGETWKELAGRVSDGLEVTLLWSESAGRVKVAVADARLAEQFEFEVAGADALAAYHHPFAYAAGRGVRFGDALRVSNDLQLQS